ncbi:hypothetical protein ACFQE1_17475, partial [Halobium palmae]
MTTVLARFEQLLCYVMAGFYVVAGAMHFVAPKVYAQIVPPQLPRPVEFVYLSGVAEIVLGLGVAIPRTRRRSAWGLVALLLAVFPANVYMATHDVTLNGAPEPLRDPSDAA